MDEEKFLPEKIEAPDLPGKWNPEEAVKRIKKNTSIAKPAVEDIVLDFWIAHEKIVRKEVTGWTWGKFCEDAGYAYQTPYIWFEKYQLRITKIGGRKPIKKLIEDKPLKKQTKPEVKKQLDNVSQAIEKGEVSNEDSKQVAKSLGKAISESVVPLQTGTAVERAIDKHRKIKKKGGDTAKKSTLETIASRLNSAANDLMGYLDSGLQPEAGDKNHMLAIRSNAPLLIMCFIKMGVNIDEIVATATGRRKEISYETTNQKE